MPSLARFHCLLPIVVGRDMLSILKILQGSTNSLTTTKKTKSGALAGTNDRTGSISDYNTELLMFFSTLIPFIDSCT